MKQLVPALWLVLLVALGVRGLVVEDARYAWGMFPYVLRYELDYRWRLDDGRTATFKPGKALGQAKKTLAPRKQLDLMYGIGALRTELRAWGRHVVDTRTPPARARAFEVELKYRKHDATEPTVEVLSFELTGGGA